MAAVVVSCWTLIDIWEHSQQISKVTSFFQSATINTCKLPQETPQERWLKSQADPKGLRELKHPPPPPLHFKQHFLITSILFDYT